jgi:hypothetical protein
VNALQNIVFPHARIFALVIAFGDLAIGLSLSLRFLCPTSFRIGADNADAQRLILIGVRVHDSR